LAAVAAAIYCLASAYIGSSLASQSGSGLVEGWRWVERRPVLGRGSRVLRVANPVQRARNVPEEAPRQLGQLCNLRSSRDGWIDDG